MRKECLGEKSGSVPVATDGEVCMIGNPVSVQLVVQVLRTLSGTRYYWQFKRTVLGNHNAGNELKRIETK